VSREDAAAGAKAVLASSKVMPGTSVPQATNVGGNQVDSSTKSSPTYYNSQKLLQNQQQQTISLLAQVPAFNGMGSTKFEDWIKHFERVVDTSEFEEGRKIKLLASKLFGSAGDCITTFQLNYPREAKSFSKIKQNLHERFHGGENRGMYFTEFKNCIRNSGESIRDYACRLQKLYSFAYPKEEGTPTDMRLQERMLMDGFLGGLKANLRERMRFKEFKTFDDLIKATERCAAILNEVKLEKRQVEFVNAVSINASAQELKETKLEMSELKIEIEKMKQKMKEKKAGNKHKEFINAVATTNNSHLVENRRESDECKEMMKINQKCLSDMMHQSRENEKLMKNIQIQATEVKQAINQIKPGMQYQPNHSSQFVDKNNQGAQQTPPYFNNNQGKQLNGYQSREKRHCVHCAAGGRAYATHNTERCFFGPDGPKCFKCKGAGHFSQQCTAPQYNPGMQNGPQIQNVGQQNPWNQGN
jgi:hypothetical protein